MNCWPVKSQRIAHQEITILFAWITVELCNAMNAS